MVKMQLHYVLRYTLIPRNSIERYQGMCVLQLTILNKVNPFSLVLSVCRYVCLSVCACVYACVFLSVCLFDVCLYSLSDDLGILILHSINLFPFFTRFVYKHNYLENERLHEFLSF